MYCNFIEGNAAMKRLIALLLIAAAIFFFAPLGGVSPQKTPKALFLERLGAMLNAQEGNYSVALDIKAPSSIVGGGAAARLLGGRTGLSLNLSGGFSGSSGSLAAIVAANPDFSLDRPAVLTDLVVDGENIYLNLRSVLSYLSLVRGERINYASFLPAEYISLSFEDLAFALPEASRLRFFEQAVLLGAAPGSRLNDALCASLKDGCFSERNGAYCLALDNSAFLLLARTALNDLAEYSGEYASLMAAQKPGNFDCEAAAAQIKDASKKLSLGLNQLTDLSIRAEIGFIIPENAYKISVFCESEREGIEISGVIKLSPGTPEKASVPRKAMSLDGILKMLESFGKMI